jgi:hypothetical protein
VVYSLFVIQRVCPFAIGVDAFSGGDAAVAERALGMRGLAADGANICGRAGTRGIETR